jgi:hypothetical protein
MLGGNANDGALGKTLAISNETGKIYMVGYTTSTVLPTVTLGTSNLNDVSLEGPQDIFIARFDSDYDLDWLTYYGGNGTDQYSFVTVNELGDVYIGFNTNSTNMSTIALNTGAFLHENLNDPIPGSGPNDGFIIKLDPDGILEYATYFGGSAFDELLGIFYSRLYNNQNEIIVVGATESSNFPNRNYPFPNSTTAYYEPVLLYPGRHSFITNLRNVSPQSRFADNTITNELKDNRGYDFIISPNPASGLVKISATSGFIDKVQVFNSLGSCVYSKSNIHDIAHNLDLNRILSGVYSVQILSGYRKYTSKLLIIRE